jgi:hypothetical protein
MNSPAKTADQSPKQAHQEKKREDRQQEKGVEDTFPASDPPSASQPGGGITGPEVVDEKKRQR